MADQGRDSYQDELLKTPAPNFSSSEVQDVASRIYGLEGPIVPLGSERDLNFHITTAGGDQFVIKIANSAEDPAIIDMQLKALDHIARVNPDLPIPRVYPSLNGLTIEELKAEDGRVHPVRVLTYLTGHSLEDPPAESAFYFELGKCAARLARALSGFFHPIANYELLWDLKHTPKLKNYVDFIPDPDQRELAGYFLDRFDRNVFPVLPQLRAQILHNDLVPDNLVVDSKDPSKIVGILDFGDLTHTYLVVDLATTVAASLRGQGDPIGPAVEIVTGYNGITPLEEAELRILYDLIGARLTMLNVIAYWRETLHPQNQEYIMGGVELTWKILEKWREQDPLAVTKRFFRACGLWELETVESVEDQDLGTLLRRRDQLLGPCAYLFYKRPLHIVRGEGVWLYDADGRKYLDVYNNVPHVGHGHPHVVNAISRQAKQLNTSTRYLHQYILELAERITERLPKELSVCTFVCTGSEANELAWRMAQMVTGNRGALITEYSYHGSTNAVAQFSTESLPVGKLPPHVGTFFPPTSNKSWRKPDSGLKQAIEVLDQKSHRPAMLLVDTSFVSDGIYTSPNGYLKKLFSETRAAGGLCVADEVQGGFGRLGEYFWGFEFDDVVPDIVTMGKPMGNGHPIAAVVTRPEIAQALADETGYFNTFGGNPVSCAAGLAVLDVIEQEGLQQNALEVGQYIVDELTKLRGKDPRLGQIHGSGLLLGAAILKPDGEPDPEMASRIMNHMRENGVLIGITGRMAHILKIRPPLVFEKEHADSLIAAIIKALDELE